jgi:hypothetical protein
MRLQMISLEVSKSLSSRRLERWLLRVFLCLRKMTGLVNVINLGIVIVVKVQGILFIRRAKP